MQITLSFKHMDHSDSLKAYAFEKSEKFAKFFSGKLHVVWNLTIEHDEKIAHCHVLGPDLDFFSEATMTDFKASIDAVAHKIEAQLRKQKDLVRDHQATPRTKRGADSAE
jgi:putative sigma-54 modulation protein